jgi:HlyD family secretion protein
MSASVDIRTEEVTDVLAVAIQSVTTREEEDKVKRGKKEEDNEDRLKDLKEVVFVVQGDTVAMIEVKTGVQDDAYIQILEGLEKGMKTVVGPYAAISRKLEQGDEVNVVDEEELYKKDD